MATRTTYYELIKPSQTDMVDVRDLNTNFDNIDAIMHTNETNIDALEDIIKTNNAGSHNAVYRGRNLGSEVTAEQYDAINNGTFEGLYIGDYWTIGGINWRIAHFDYWINTGDTQVTKHHAVIVPDVNLYTAQMNTSDSTTGGYYNSAMRGGSDYTDPTDGGNLKTAFATVASAFGASHILSHRELFVDTVTGGKASAHWWYDSTVDLMSEIMVYGSLIGSAPGGIMEVGIDKQQFVLFKLNHSAMTVRSGSTWLRGIVDAQRFCSVAYFGNVGAGAATDARGVRPCFGLVKQ